MKPAQPVNPQSTALGVAIRKVIVEQVIPERGVAIVRDGQQYTTEVPYRVQQGRGRVPQVGDYWYVDRSLGPWVFSTYIAPDDAALTTFAEQTAFAKGLTIPAGQLVRLGDVPASSTAIVGVRVPLVSTSAIALGVSGDTVSRHVIFPDGKMEWGAGGVAARDVNLYRSAANALSTNGTIIATWDMAVSGAFIRSVFSAASTTKIEPLVSATGVDAQIITVSATFKAGYAYKISYRFRTQHTGGTGPYVATPKLKRATASGTLVHDPGSFPAVSTNFISVQGSVEVKNTTGGDHTQTIVLTGAMSTSGSPTSMDVEASTTAPTVLTVEVIGHATQYPGAVEVPTA